MSQGKLIVLEGTDGSGKATQTQMLFDRLLREGISCRKLCFPRYGEPSAAPIELYLQGKLGAHADDVSPYAASALFAVDRFCSYRQDWGEYYENGGILITDRYTTSNAIHQASKLPDGMREAFLDWLFRFEYEQIDLPAPSLVFYLDVPTEVTEKMMREREAKTNTQADIHEKDEEYLLRCRMGAEAIIARCGWQKIDCTEDGEMRAREDIHEELYQKVKALF